MRRVFQWLVALAALGIPISAVGDDLEDFVIAGDDLFDFAPAISQEASALWGHLVFVAGTGPPLSVTSRDAMIIAVDTRRAAEVWRVSTGEPGRLDSYHSVAASSGRVCAVGRGSESLIPGPTVFLLVGCYKAKSGKPLWERELAMEGSRLAIGLSNFSIRLSRTALVVTLNDFPRRVLLFDARDGS